MYRERLQLLLSKAQREHLDREARERNTSIASIVREAIDTRYKVTSQTDQLAAVERIRAMRAPAPTIEELEAMLEERYRSTPPVSHDVLR